MKIGAILSPREVDGIRSRLMKSIRETEDRRLREQIRMVISTLNKAERRAAKKMNSIN